MDNMTNDQLIDDILIRLFNDDDYRIDFSILKIQIERDSNFQITDALKKTILDKLIAEDLCLRLSWNNDSTLELTPNGKKIIYKHKSYSNYLQFKKVKEAEEKELEELKKKNLKLQNDKLESEKYTGEQEFRMQIGKETIDKLMRLAIDNGKQSISEEGKLTPKVGAAIFKDGEILGAAHRGQKGTGDHAEYTLFEKVLNGADVSGATLFTTLEPCTSRGQHTPCSDWIIKKNIKHVFIGLLDPNPKIYNHGCKKLIAAGIEVSFFPHELRQEIIADNVAFIAQYQANTDLKGTVTFNYTNNNGKYIIGNNEMMFETKWTRKSDQSIHVYNDPPSIKTVSIADGNTEIYEVKDGTIYDVSSRTRSPCINEIVIIENNNGFFAAIKILGVKDKTRPNNDRDELSFEYQILSDKTYDFTNKT